MSLEINGDNDYVIRNGAANLGNATSGTYLGGYFKNDATNNDIAMVFAKSGTSSNFRTVSATEMKMRVGSNDSSPFAANSGAWHKLAITISAAGVFNCYAGPMSGALALVYTDSSTNTNEISSVGIGQDGGSYTSARGCHRYYRYWAGRVLTLGELEAEFAMTPSGGTPAASATNLYFSWPLPDGTDTTDLTGNGRVPTISGAVTSAEEPTIGGGASPVAKIAQQLAA